MQVTLKRPAGLTAAEIAAWHGMQAADQAQASPFLCPEFAVAVGRQRPAARVAVLRDGGELAGFFPFERRRLGLGVPVGSGLSDCQGLVHAAGARWDTAGLLASCGLAAFHFDHLASGQPFAACGSATAASPVVDLSGGFDGYQQVVLARSPRFWRDLARKRRKLEREAGELRFVLDTPDTGDLRRLMGWKSEQYRRTGRGDRFDRPWIVGLVEDLLSHRSGSFRGVLSMLYAGGRPVAGHFGIAHGGILAEWFPAYDTAFARYSPGLIQLVAMIEQAPALGVRSIDLGKGAMRYKEELKSYDLTVAEGAVTGRSPAGAVARVRLAAPRWAVRQIRAHRGLYTAADRVLKGYGRVRVALRPAR